MSAAEVSELRDAKRPVEGASPFDGSSDARERGRRRGRSAPARVLAIAAKEPGCAVTAVCRFTGDSLEKSWGLGLAASGGRAADRAGGALHSAICCQGPGSLAADGPVGGMASSVKLMSEPTSGSNYLEQVVGLFSSRTSFSVPVLHGGAFRVGGVPSGTGALRWQNFAHLAEICQHFG